jgi:hypothetical protein
MKKYILGVCFAFVMILTLSPFSTSAENITIISPEIFLEAESASYQDLNIASNHPGFTGAGFLEVPDQRDKEIEFTYNCSEAGEKFIQIIYGNGAGRPAHLSISINNEESILLTLPQTTQQGPLVWQDWLTYQLELPYDFSQGEHTIVISTNTEQGNHSGPINFDKIVIAKETTVVRYDVANPDECTAVGVEMAQGWEGYTGLGHSDWWGLDEGQSLSFEFDVETGGLYTIEFRIGGGGKPRCSWALNGTTFPEKLTLNSTNFWDAWTSDYRLIELEPGKNTLRLSIERGDPGNTNFDYLALYKGDARPDSVKNSPDASIDGYSKMEAEAASLEGNANVASNNPGYSGTGFVAMPDTNDGINYSITNTSAGDKNFIIRYANGSGHSIEVTVQVGEHTQVVNLIDTGGWSSYRTATASIPVPIGENFDLQIIKTGAGPVNIDYIAFENPVNLYKETIIRSTVNTELPYDSTYLFPSGTAQQACQNLYVRGVIADWVSEMPSYDTIVSQDRLLEMTLRNFGLIDRRYSLHQNLESIHVSAPSDSTKQAAYTFVNAILLARSNKQVTLNNYDSSTPITFGELAILLDAAYEQVALAYDNSWMAPDLQNPVSIDWGAYKYMADLVGPEALSQWSYVREYADRFLLHGAYWGNSPASYDVMQPMADAYQGTGKKFKLEFGFPGPNVTMDEDMAIDVADRHIVLLNEFAERGMIIEEITLDYMLYAYENLSNTYPDWGPDDVLQQITGDTSLNSSKAFGGYWTEYWDKILAEFPEMKFSFCFPPIYYSFGGISSPNPIRVGDVEITGDKMLESLVKSSQENYPNNFLGYVADSPAEFFINYDRYGEKVQLIEDFIHEKNAKFGLICIGSPDETIDLDAWDKNFFEQTMNQIYNYQISGGRADCFQIQSWLGGPYAIVPETSQYTFTNLVLEAIKYTRGPGQRLDLSIYTNNEIYGGGTYNTLPGGISTVSVDSEFTLLVTNNGEVKCMPMLKVSDEFEGVSFYYKGNDITALITGEGYCITDMLEPGETIEITATIADNSDANINISAYWNPQDATNVLRDIVSITTVAPDNTAPIVTAGAVNRTSDTAGTVKFTSDEAGQYYYAVVADGAAAPTINTAGAGIVCTTSETTITNPTGLTAGAKDIYIQVKDAAGNVSVALKIDIGGFVQSNVDDSDEGNSTPTIPPTTQAIVDVDGKQEISSIEEGKTVITVELNKTLINSKIEEIIKTNPTGTNNSIQIPVADTKSDIVRVELTGDIVRRLEENTFNVSIKRDTVEYLVPAEEFAISKVAKDLGVTAESLKDIKIEVQITKLDATVTAKYHEVAKANGAQLIFPPVAFEIVAKTTKEDGTTADVQISKFSNYVERIMEIPAGVDPSKITTGIVFNPDGTYSHVPTEVFLKDGKWYAKLNSLTNSNYSVLWNPVTVKSVEKHWAKDAVNDMASRLVIFNPESFDPNKAITRADFVAYIVRALGLYREGSKHENKFKDVFANGDGTLAILIASEYGIVTGYPDGTFRPDALMTREEAMTMYQRAMKVTKLVGTDDNRYQNFTDYKQVGSWATTYVQAVLSAHVFNGTTATTISPKSNLTYAEAAQAIKNLLVESKLINK